MCEALTLHVGLPDEWQALAVWENEPGFKCKQLRIMQRQRGRALATILPLHARHAR